MYLWTQVTDRSHLCAIVKLRFAAEAESWFVVSKWESEIGAFLIGTKAEPKEEAARGHSDYNLRRVFADCRSYDPQSSASR
jgi:heme-degrading monooxygenase HmoA